MRRLVLALALAVVMAATVVACGGTTTDDATSAAPVATPSETASLSAPGADQAAVLFADDCAGCHGADGSGGSGPDLRGEDDLAGVKSQIESGGGPMPAFSGQLSPDQIEALTQYVVTELQ